MAAEIKNDQSATLGTSHLTDATIRSSSSAAAAAAAAAAKNNKPKSKGRDRDSTVPIKRRCVSTACIACRRRKSKCDGNTPSCAACASVYGTECIYDPNSDHRRKGVYKKDIDNLKTRNSTLQILVQAILNYPEHEVFDLVRQIRTCENLDGVAESILAKENGLDDEDEVDPFADGQDASPLVPTFETQLSGKMGQLRLEDGSVRFIGGTSNLIFLGSGLEGDGFGSAMTPGDQYQQQANPTTSWTEVTKDAELVNHLMTMYFTWHYTFFATLSKNLFYRDFNLGKPPPETRRRTEHCTPLLVNAMLALGCHFTSRPEARSNRDDPATAGDHFFREAKRLILENDEHEKPKLTTVQAFALMSVREAGCGREAKGWVYSGMSFRMAWDIGLNLDSGHLKARRDPDLDEQEEDARRVTFWGCFLFDKCWSNYLGRQPQLPASSVTVPKFDVFPEEEAESWSPYSDSGVSHAHAQPARTRTVARKLSELCEISSDLLQFFYHPSHLEKPVGKQSELKKLSELHTRLEDWKKTLPKEMEAKEGALANVLVMQPFLRYNQSTSPLPANVSPRKLCTHAAAMISKLLRLYRRTYGLRQICNIAVYIAHSACTIHLLNLPEKNAKRDIIHGVKHMEEIAEGWLCARRTLGILSLLVKRWKVELPEEAAVILNRHDAAYGPYDTRDSLSPKSDRSSPPTVQNFITRPPMTWSDPSFDLQSSGFLDDIAEVCEIPNGQPHAPMALPRHLELGVQAPYIQPQRYDGPRGSPASGDRMPAFSNEQIQVPQTYPLDSDRPPPEGSSRWWYNSDPNSLATGFENWTNADLDQYMMGDNTTGFNDL
ncbi:MAG: hypothetical protein M1819_005452 [Sarea resinae]|nr:MAG: hypothetical protein M1819_005452 [Sarea resinae]